MSNVLVVGGSHGIGAAIVARLADHHQVTNISRTKPEHPGITHHGLDVVSDDLPDIDAVDHIIYCPGSINLKPIGSLKEQDFIDDFHINVLGAVRVVKKYLRKLKKGNDPSVVMFSTVAVAQGMPFHASIAVAKAGVQALSKTLAAELAPTVRVNCIAPSITDTPLANKILKSDKARENLVEKHPLKRILQADDIANMAVYLISDQAKGITGQVIGIDAGLGSLKL